MSGLRGFFQRGRLAEDVYEEIRAHLDEKTEALVQAGLSPEEAAARARRDFGNTLLIEERARDVWRWGWLEDLLFDVRFAGRQLLRTPTLTLVVTLTLALGIGATTSVYSVIDGVLLRPLQYPSPSSLVALYDTQGDQRDLPASYPEYVDWRDHTGGVFSDVGAIVQQGQVLSGSGDAEQLQSVMTSANVPAMLGVQPMLGRGLEPADDAPGAPRVVVLSDRIWRSHFGGDPAIIGRAITLTGQPYVVVGIYPASEQAVIPKRGAFARGESPDLWTPLRLTEKESPRGLHYISVIARLARGISASVAADRLATIAAQIDTARGTTHGIALAPLTGELVGNLRAPLALLLAAVVLLLAIACTNAANLLLARATARRRELALRAALGAGRARVVCHVLLEGVVRASLGGACGVALAYGLMAAARRWLTDVPRVSDVAIDVRALGVAALLSIASGLLASVVPATRAARGDLVGGLREGARGILGGQDRVRHALVIGQITLSFALLVVGALLVRSFQELAAVPTGFDARDLVSAATWLPPAGYPDSLSQIAFNSRLVDAMGRRFGPANVTLSSDLPVGGGTSGDITIAGRSFAPGDAPIVEKRIVANDYFDVLGARMLAGRSFTSSDELGAPAVAVVNAAFAKRWFPHESAVGRRIGFGWNTTATETIVGVVADVREGPLDAPPPPAVYVSSAQVPSPFMRLIVRTARGSNAVTTAYRDALRTIDPALPVIQVTSLSDWIASGIHRRRLTAAILSAFALAALLLAAVGLFGVISYSVAQRTRELGVRAALGALSGDLAKLVLRQVAAWLVIGMAAGALLALLGGKLVATQLYGVTRSDPRAFALSALLLAVVAISATAAPVLRAARSDPLEALRAD